MTRSRSRLLVLYSTHAPICFHSSPFTVHRAQMARHTTAGPEATFRGRRIRTVFTQACGKIASICGSASPNSTPDHPHFSRCAPAYVLTQFFRPCSPCMIVELWPVVTDLCGKLHVASRSDHEITQTSPTIYIRQHSRGRRLMYFGAESWRRGTQQAGRRREKTEQSALNRAGFSRFHT